MPRKKPKHPHPHEATDMAISVTPNLTDISMCEVITGWSSGTINAIDQIQYNNCIGLQVKATTSAIIKYDMGAGGTSFTGKHLYGWLKVNGTPDTKAAGGLRLYVEDTSGNFGVWYVGGKDTPGGWQCYVIDPASTPTTGTGTIVVSAIRYVGCQFKTLSSALGSTLNCFWDAFRYGTGLTVTSGVADAITFENIFAEDDNTNNKYGVVTKAYGAYIVQGLLTFGGTGTENIDFVDKNQIVLFPDNTFVSTSFYGIQVLAGSGTVNFTLGEKSGTAGIKGCYLKAVGTRTFSFNVSDTDIDKMLLYGCTFKSAGATTFLPTAANREVLNCTFDTCGEVIADTVAITNCNFFSAAADALQISSESHGVTYCNFIGCSRGIDFTSGSTFSATGLKFTNCTYDLKNSTGGAITINCTAGTGSNPSTVENNNASIVSSAILKLSGLVVGTEIRVYDHGTTTELAGTESSGSGGTFEWEYNPSTYNHVDISVVSYSYLDIWYNNMAIDANGLTIPVQQQVDRQYLNPPP